MPLDINLNFDFSNAQKAEIQDYVTDMSINTEFLVYKSMADS